MFLKINVQVLKCPLKMQIKLPPEKQILVVESYLSIIATTP